MKPHLIAIFSGIILIITGFYSFFSNDERPLTALIGPLVGLIFIASSPAIKKENKTISHIIVVLTLVFGVMTGIMAYNSSKLPDGEERERRIQVFSSMAITCIGAFGYYVYGFIEKKKIETNSNQA